MATWQSNSRRRAEPRDPNADGERQPGSASAATGANGALLVAEDVAALVGMTKEWIYAETRAGRIPHVTLGRYYRYRHESIDAWLREMEQRATRSSRKPTTLR
jgi:excisionase family DNA binding protein